MAGKFDVEDVELTPDKAGVLYTSNQNDEDRRHVFKIPLVAAEIVNGKAIGVNVPITHGATIEWHPLMLADGKTIVSFGSTATSPAMPYRLTEKGREMIAASALPKDFPSDQLVEPQTVTFKSEDGLKLRTAFCPAQSSLSKSGGDLCSRRPRQMMPVFQYMYYYHNAYAQNQYLASRGYVVLSVNYRLGAMYGRAFREAANAGWRGSSEYKDVVAGARYLQGLQYVDRKRIGIWGGSYGGLLTALALARNSDIFAAGVDSHGVHDWSALLAGRGGDAPDAKEAAKLAFDSSPVASVADGSLRCSSCTVTMIKRSIFPDRCPDRLRRQNVEIEQIVFPDEIHDFLLWRTWVRGYKAGAEFFDRKLGGAKNPRP